MASPPRLREGITLEEFLRLPQIDEPPYLEYIDGRIEPKVSPQKKHSRIAIRLGARLDQFAEAGGLGAAFVELRCTFAGRSILPDLVFLRQEHIDYDEQGLLVNETCRPPDLHVEIVSPDQSIAQNRRRLAHSLAHGCALGWLIDPERRVIEVHRPGQAPERLPADGTLSGEPVLPGFRLGVAEVFGWLVRPRPGPGADHA
ncbi:MAG: Uma2 family endonuclease [Isosphaeraceae bacterium]|nr:Uma2 family endonuclease [Isosphaeraceae bacterium]